MSGYAPKDNLKLPGLAAIGASVTDQVISKSFPITAPGALNFIARVKCSAVTVGAGVSVKLRTAIDDVFVDSKSATVSGNGYVYIKIQQALVADQTYTPLLCKGQIVATTGAGSAVTIDQIDVLQED